ncbi:MAG: type II toxin-antitoxin system VapC family toxin [Vulcanimicrobiaceae bacterium]
MRLLLDTVALLWLLADAPELSAAARRELADSEAEIYVSPVSTWEIVTKYRLGQLPLPAPPEELLPRERRARGLLEAPLGEAAVLHLGRLPLLHRDPFDLMLICQAIEEQLVIVTPDTMIRRYPVKTFW